MPSLASIAGDAGLPWLGGSVVAGVTAPAADAAVATIASTNLPAGLYKAHVWTRTTGNPETLEHNMELRAGAVVLAGGLLSTSQRGGYRAVGRYFQLDGSTAVTVNATATASSGVVYHARVLLERVA